jgi:hypothetical protein
MTSNNQVILSVGKAHQRLIREQKALDDLNAIEQPIWHNINRDISNAVVKPVDMQTATKMVEEYEWLGTMSPFSLFLFGIFYDGVCAGVTVFRKDYIENLGHWDKYNYTGRMLLLSRGVCVHWAHPHSGSKLIMESIKMLPPEYDVITCTTDQAAGEIGTIYQACNFDYVGSMRESNDNIKTRKPKDRFGVKIDGKIYGARAMRQKLGSQRKDVILLAFPDAEFVPQYNKHRYFYFRGSKSNRKFLRKSIQHIIKPYPKRS